METVAHAKQGRGTAWLLGSACALAVALVVGIAIGPADRKSTRLNSSH